jgi:hypothetical protein
MRQHLKTVAGALALLAAVSSARAALPPEPASIQNQAVLACVRVDAGGKVSGAYLMSSTGDAARDADFLARIKQLQWAKPDKRDKTIDQWLPMGLALGKAKAPPSPKSCDAPKDGG